MQFRYYQDEAIEDTFDWIRGNPGHPLIQLPTGTGKSVVLGGFIQRAIQRWRGTRIMMLTHSKTLVEQNAAKLRSMWPDAPMGIYSAGLRKRELGHDVTFAGIDSVAAKPHVFGKQNIVLVDEAHMIDWRAKTRYRKFIGGLMEVNPKLRVVGLTATPWRMGLGHIATPQDGELGDRILFGGVSYSKIGIADFHEFTCQGFLSPLHPLGTNLTFDVSQVSTTAGDFNAGELQQAVNKEYLTKAAIQESIALAGDRKAWIVFCTGKEHVENTVQYLREAGISAVGVHSGQSDTVNDANVKLALSGQVQALVNMGVLTTGFDWPELSYIMMLRPTKSPMLWVQMLGRGTRPAPWAGKVDCLVGDFAGNTDRLGPINDPVIPRAKGKGGGGVAPVKECEKCKTKNHTTAVRCQKCGHVFPPPKEKITTVASRSKLVKDLDDGNPVVEVFEVTGISYQVHKKFDKPDSIKVTYTCGFRMFNEYVCLEHEGYAAVKAKQWWTKRMAGDVPTSTADALEIVHLASTATHIRVHTNLKYPAILDACFDGTAFGTIDPMVGERITPTVAPRIALGTNPWGLRPEGIISEDDRKAAYAEPIPEPAMEGEFEDDDIPF